MKHPLSILILSVFTALTAAGGAEKQKEADVNGYPFWTGGKKAGAVTQFAPGLNAALQLSDAQKQQISAARDEVNNDEAVKSARSISKSDPNVTAEQREKARAAVDAANAKLRERVAAILTPEQKALIEKVSAAYAAANEETGIVYSEKFASPSIKADPDARRRLQQEKSQDLEEGFLHKLDDILTPAQKEAMKRAADDEAKRGAAAGTVKKPVKQ
jgi:Spy/CpxP family protein refolding chaperone